MHENVLLEEMFKEMLEYLSPRIEKKQLSVSIQVMSEMKLIGSRVMLYRAMRNLIENAVKYNHACGSVFILAEKQDSIFEPFYRVDQSRSRAVGGAGLGLALVKDVWKSARAAFLQAQFFS